MNAFLNVLAMLIEGAAKVASASTSLFLYYQPEKPECLRHRDSEKE